MNPLELQLSYPHEERLPEPAGWIAVMPGVHWIRMPLPFQLDHINLWLLRDRIDGRDGWTVVDCGIASDGVRALWERLFADALEGLPVLRVLCTHMHPDHVGLAAWITRRFDAPLWMTLGEYSLGRLLSSGVAERQSSGRFFALHGATAEQVQGVARTASSRYAHLVPEYPESFVRMLPDAVIAIGGRRFRMITGFGHSPEHASLYCAEDRLLISGDMVLPRISTNCSVYEVEPLANPVQWFVDSLARYDDCAEDTLVLPSHGRPFRGLATRIGQLRTHHDDRLAKLLEACLAEPLAAADAIPVLFDGRRFADHQFMFALGESLAHLHALWHRGQVARRTDRDGVVRFGAPTAD